MTGALGEGTVCQRHLDRLENCLKRKLGKGNEREMESPESGEEKPHAPAHTGEPPAGRRTTEKGLECR